MSRIVPGLTGGVLVLCITAPRGQTVVQWPTYAECPAPDGPDACRVMHLRA